MGWQNWDGEQPRKPTDEEIRQREINTQLVIEWLQSPIGQLALEFTAEDYKTEAHFLQMIFAVRNYADELPEGIIHRINSADVIKAIWGDEKPEFDFD